MATMQHNRNRLLLKLTASLLAFLFILTPFIPVWAKVVAPLPPTQDNGTTAGKFKKNNSLSQEEQLAKVREYLLDNKLPQIALDRLNLFEAELKEGPQEKNLFTKTLDFITGNTDEQKEKQGAIEFAKKAPFRVETFEGKINTASVDNYERNFSGTEENENLISRLFAGQKKFSGFNLNPDDYLAEGGEITFSQAIKDQANALNNNPLAMLNFVRNEVEYIPYYGSKKGSDATLVEFAGNDIDKASLLIAMLRYSNIPARYHQVDAKMEIRTVTDLLGVDSAIAAARILSLEKIPYTLYTNAENDDPLYFVVEHTYVEAYMPYGYSRGIDLNDGGAPQWVPMDPTTNAYYYEQLVDIVEGMNNDGFDVKVFFENYLDGDYGTSEPLDAFKSEVKTRLPGITPEYYPNLTYEDALTHSYPKKDNLEFIPGSLPFDISADLNTYDYIPATLRHTIVFTIKDKSDRTVLTHNAYVSDLADKELLVTYNAATPADQTIINTFDTIYDVVPLSLVAVKPTIKINGNVVAISATSATLGQSQKYTMEFNIPTRVLGGPINTIIAETTESNILTGNTHAIALNTDRIIPLELRPTADTASGSFMSDQMLYRTALDFLDRLQYTQGELADIIGSDFTHLATSATISNGIKVINSSGQPYSFDWIGLRIDAPALVRYFNRFNENTNTHRPEFVAVLALQASQDESDIFEDNFNVESVATVKGLKLVSSGQFSGVTMKKITSANESDINSMQVSATTKTIFHTAIADGHTIFTPTKPITYGEWQGLFYITTNFNDEASYIIGEGLNGGYSACSMPGVASTLCNWTQNFFDLLVPQAEAANDITATIRANPVSVFVGQTVNIIITYTKNLATGVVSWTKNFVYHAIHPGVIKISPQYVPSVSTTINTTPPPNPLNINTEKIYTKCGLGFGNCTTRDRKASDIKQIVLHFTVDNSADQTIREFNKNLGNGVSAHYIIDRDGKIYQMVKDKDLSFHAGCRSRDINDDCDDQYGAASTTIGIELNNWGPLTYDVNTQTYKNDSGGNFIPSSNRKVYDNVTSWHGWRYWEDAYSPQMNSLKALIEKLTDDYAVEKVVYEQGGIKNIMDYVSNEAIISNFNGILGHSIIADYKHDPGPAFQKALFDALGI